MADSSDCEKLPSNLSSSDDNDDNCISIKNKIPKPTTDQETEEEEEDDRMAYGLFEEYQSETQEPGDDEDDSELFMKEMLDLFHPGLIDGDKFSLEYTERYVFPTLPARALLRLRHASARWGRLISSPFFAHTHSLTVRSLTGFFFHDHFGLPSFSSLDPDDSSLSIRDASLSFLPEIVVIKASNHGLLFCRGRAAPQKYYICNPMTGQWAELPPTIDDHGPETAAVIVMQEPLTFNFNDNYFLVCAYEIFEGVYGFETFSSESWAWRKSNEIVAAERVVPASGVAVGGVAYWRTTMQSVVAFDPMADACQEMLCPAPPEVASRGRWEIGEVGRKLCVVSVGPTETEVRVWEDGSWWKEVGSIEGAGAVVPLRAQGGREVAVWDGSRAVVTTTDLELRTVRRSEHPGYCADFLPYVGSLLPAERRG